MSVKNQPTYIQLTTEIDSLELQRDQLISQSGSLQSQIDVLTNNTIPSWQASLISWQNAGNSDMANKNAKIARDTAGLAKAKADREALINQKTTLDFSIREVKNQIKSLTSQRNAFEQSYKNAIMEGKSADEAALIGNVSAESEAENQSISVWKKPMTWVIILLVAAAITTAVILIKKHK